jgi:phage tail sheath gpL-like
VVFRDVQALYQLMAGLGIIRADLSYEHGQKALADSNPANLGSISTPKDIKATLVHSYQKCVNRGIFENAEGFAARLVVERDAGNSNRVNVLAPIDRVNALDVLAGNAKLYGQYAA